MLDASGLHPFSDEAFEAPPARGRGAVYGLLLGFGLTLALGVWLLQPQIGGLSTDDGAGRASAAPREPAAADGMLAPGPELAPQAPAAASPVPSEPVVVPPPPVDAPALAQGADEAAAAALRARLAAEKAGVQAKLDTRGRGADTNSATRRMAAEARRTAREQSRAATRQERRALAPIAAELRSEARVPVPPPPSIPEEVPANPY